MLFALLGYQFPYPVMNRCLYLMCERMQDKCYDDIQSPAIWEMDVMQHEVIFTHCISAR